MLGETPLSSSQSVKECDRKNVLHVCAVEAIGRAFLAQPQNPLVLHLSSCIR